jgi:predicted PhzF superfamily epimerase YddE/YHI9
MASWSLMLRSFVQVDVFAAAPYLGNPVAVVLDCDGVTPEGMQRFARWTNLSETTFVLPPTRTEADYRVRIFTPSGELPFAGHPTLGTCHAWLGQQSGGIEKDTIVQECAAGLVPIRRAPTGLAFGAPPMLRYGPVAEADLDRAATALGLQRREIVDAHWVDNGPGWMGLLLGGADRVLDLDPMRIDQPLGVIGPHTEGSSAAFEVRAFLPAPGGRAEDPVTGSLNASLAEWLIAAARARPPYVVTQGTRVGAAGRVHIEQGQDGKVWVGGHTVTAIAGTVDL